MIENKPTFVLLSGGVDSTACVHYYLSQGFDVKGVFIDYGQVANKNEYNSALNIASYYKIHLDHLVFKSLRSYSQGEIKGRNAFLVVALLLANPRMKGIISMGIHSGTPYYDCSESFINDINMILNGYTDGQTVLEAPFLKWDKKMVYHYCEKYKLPIHLTYSCENGTDVPCGRCLSCLDRSALNVG